ncbi:MAG: hypothetical protein U0935_17940 [Pirellulales bacterium]
MSVCHSALAPVVLSYLRLTVVLSLAFGVGARPSVAADNDPSRGWLVGDTGFASQAGVPTDSVVEFRLLKMGNSRGVVVTFSGNADIYQPGKLWSRQELREGASDTYSIGPALANRRLAIRSGAANGGFDRPLKVETVEGKSHLYFAGGRVVEVTVRSPPMRR